MITFGNAEGHRDGRWRWLPLRRREGVREGRSVTAVSKDYIIALDSDSGRPPSRNPTMVARANIEIVYGFTFTAQAFYDVMKEAIRKDISGPLPVLETHDDNRYSYLRKPKPPSDRDVYYAVTNTLYRRMQSLLPETDRWEGDGPFYRGGFHYADDRVTIYFGRPVVSCNSSNVPEGCYGSTPFDPEAFNILAAKYRERALLLRREYESLGVNPTEVGWYRMEYTN